MRTNVGGHKGHAFPACFVAAFLLFTAAPGHSEPHTPNKEPLEFEVQRDGVPVGQHRVSFARDGKDLRVDIVFDIKIKLFGLTLYSLEYSSQSRWRNGKLESLDARTNDDGTVSTVSAKRVGDAYRISGPDGMETVRGDLIPTNHWNIAVTESDRVLNTITGKVNTVRMRDLGEECIEAEERTVEAQRWAYTGDLESEVWYGQHGEWVKMRFEGRDGSQIEYVCKRCLSSHQRMTTR